MNIGFISYKGGQGVTVTACAYAVAIATEDDPVVIVGDDDTAAVLGLSPSAAEGGLVYPVTPFVTFSTSPIPDVTNVLDGQEGDRTYVVTRHCYVALRRASRHTLPDSVVGIITIREPQRALSDRDIETVLGKPVVTSIEVDPAVARAVDAGLLSTRLPWALSSLNRLTIPPAA